MTLYANFGLQASQAKRSAGVQRDSTLAQNAYSRFLAQKRGTRSFAELDKARTRGLERLGASYGQRGLRNSGLYKQGQTDYAQDWLQQRTDIQDSMTDAFRQSQMGDSAAWANYYAVEGDAEALKQAQILSTASSLDEFRPFLGS